jgi:hypothetical protein
LQVGSGQPFSKSAIHLGQESPGYSQLALAVLQPTQAQGGSQFERLRRKKVTHPDMVKPAGGRFHPSLERYYAGGTGKVTIWAGVERICRYDQAFSQVKLRLRGPGGCMLLTCEASMGSFLPHNPCQRGM